MRPEHWRYQTGSARQQRGSTLMMAVFILVVMVLLSTALLRTLEQESVSVGLETNGTRAWGAAQSGIDWGLARVLNRGAESAADACTGAANAVNGRTLSPTNGLADLVAFDRCTVALTCALSSGHASALVTNGFAITATASCGSPQIRATRIVETLAYD